MKKFLMKIKKVREIIFKTEVIIIALIVLTVAGWGSAFYLNSQKSEPQTTCGERFDKMNSYASLLNKSMKLAREDQSLDILEIDVRMLDNGTLLAEWEDVVFGGNRQEDLNDYFDVITDSLIFFSK